jgi:general stress protein 26
MREMAMNETGFEISDLLIYVRSHKIAVVSTRTADGAPQGALVGFSATDSLELIFDTICDSRKHQNLLYDHRIAVTLSGPEEQTLQLEGIAHEVSVRAVDDAVYREAYYRTWPDGRERLKWGNLSYWRISPRWARYSDYSRGPLVAEFRWDGN